MGWLKRSISKRSFRECSQHCAETIPERYDLTRAGLVDNLSNEATQARIDARNPYKFVNTSSAPRCQLFVKRLAKYKPHLPRTERKVFEYPCCLVNGLEETKT